MSTAKFLARRLALFAFTLWCVLTIMFFLFKLLPGDPTAVFLDNNFSADTIEQQKKLWGLTDPMWVQYFRYIGNMLTMATSTATFDDMIDHRLTGTYTSISI